MDRGAWRATIHGVTRVCWIHPSNGVQGEEWWGVFGQVGRESGAEGLYGADTKKRNACKGVGAQRQEWAAPAHCRHHHLPRPTSMHVAAVLDPALSTSSPLLFFPILCSLLTLPFYLT